MVEIIASDQHLCTPGMFFFLNSNQYSNILIIVNDIFNARHYR